MAATLIRARVAHTPGDPFAGDSALECHENGAVAFADGRIVATGDFTEVSAAHPDADRLRERHTQRVLHSWVYL